MERICLIMWVTLFQLLCLNANAQSRSAEEISNQPIQNVEQYSPSKKTSKSFVVKMGFGNADILEQLEDFQVIGATIDHIDLVYTDYPKGANLKKLNFNRIKEMEKFHPVLVSNPLIKWNIIRQIGCRTEIEARSYFHGIIVYYEMYSDVDYVEKVNTKLEKYLPNNLNKELAQRILDTIKKPTVNEVFKRHKYWSNAVLIVDLTTSMIPYNSQVVLWQLLNTDRGFFKEVVMFNDGDSAPEHAKEIGKTGGIYYDKNVSFETLRKNSIKVCRNGLGNADFPENDLEAVLFAIKQNPNANEYILIADNDAPPRDMELLDKIYRPIRIILCDTDKGILPEYLEIARRTGGSVHTIKEDLVDLIKQKEGQIFTAGGRKYAVKDGRVVLVK
jgi:hypothetical protein